MSWLEVWLVSMLDPLNLIFAVAALVPGSLAMVLSFISVMDPPPRGVWAAIAALGFVSAVSATLLLVVPTESVYLKMREAAPVCGDVTSE